MKQTYTGGCQCGNVKYEVEAEIGEVIACNCSRCGRLGSLLTFVPKEAFKLKSGEDATTEYRFNKNVIHHLFCSTCGIESYAIGTPPGGAQEVVAINVRCLDGVNPEELDVKHFDGKSIG